MDSGESKKGDVVAKRERDPDESPKSVQSKRPSTSSMAEDVVPIAKLQRRVVILESITSRQASLECKDGQLMDSNANMVEIRAMEKSNHDKRMQLHEEPMIELRKQSRRTAEMQAENEEHLVWRNQYLNRRREESLLLMDRVGRCLSLRIGQLQ